MKEGKKDGTGVGQEKENKKVPIYGYIALIVALLFFSGIFKDIEGPMKVFDFTNLLGSFGEISENLSFRGSGGFGVRDGWLFALSLAPGVMFALGIVQIIEDLHGLDAAQNLLTPILQPLLGIPGASGLAMIASLQSTDAGAAMTRDLYEVDIISEKQRIVFLGFQFVGGALLTNFLSTGSALFSYITVPIIIPLLIIFVFKFICANFIRLYLKFAKVEVENGK